MTPPPRMHRTRPRDLLAPSVLVGAIAYALLRVGYGALPPLSYFIPVPLAALAVVELVAARRVRAAVRHDPRARPMAALVIARCVALGKASSLVGAAVLGASCALLGRVLPTAGSVDAAAHDGRVGGFLFVACVLLVAAGLVLERAGLDPGRDERGRA
jgi:hypothetical protein